MKEKRMEGRRRRRGNFSVDCRVSAVVVQLVGKHWTSFRKIMVPDLSLLSLYIHHNEYDRNK